jgi:hypothetical protein
VREIAGQGPGGSGKEDPLNPASPAGPGDSELPGRIRTDDLTMVAVTGTVNALTGAVIAVTWGRDPALDVTGTVPALIAVTGCQSLSRRADGLGHLPLATRRLLAHGASRNARLRDQSCDRYLQHVSPRSPESIPAASLLVASLVTCLT